MRSPRASSSSSRARPLAIRVLAPPAMRTPMLSRATRATSSIVRACAPRTTCSMTVGYYANRRARRAPPHRCFNLRPESPPRLLHREGALGLVCLIAHRVLHLHRDRILAGTNVRLQADAEGCRDVALRIERLRLLGSGFRLRPEYLAAGRHHRSHIAHVDLVLFAVFESGDIEFGPHPVAGFVYGLGERLVVIFILEETEIANHEGVARLHFMAAYAEWHGEFLRRLGEDIFHLDQNLVLAGANQGRNRQFGLDSRLPALIL